MLDICAIIQRDGKRSEMEGERETVGQRKGITKKLSTSLTS